MPKTQFHTNYLLWLLAAGCVFIGLGFVDPFGGYDKADNSLWAVVAVIMSGDCSGTAECVRILLILAGLLVAPAVLLGWVTQALLVVAWSAVRRGPSPDSSKTEVL